MKKIKDKIFPISMWALWGITLGTALHNMVIGFSLGFVMVVAFGLSRNDD